VRNGVAGFHEEGQEAHPEFGQHARQRGVIDPVRELLRVAAQIVEFVGLVQPAKPDSGRRRA
jgi:hypothetical protein